MYRELYSLTWSLVQWTLLDLVPLVSSSGQTTLLLVRIIFHYNYLMQERPNEIFVKYQMEAFSYASILKTINHIETVIKISILTIHQFYHDYC